jgi:hypothetical protein
VGHRLYLVRLTPSQAFRSFQITPKLIEAHGYRELTPSLKRKISVSMVLASI